MNQPSDRPTSNVELSLSREDDGDVNIELYIDRRHLITIAVSEEGHINWAGVNGDASDHANTTDPKRLGKFLFNLLLDEAIKAND